MKKIIIIIMATALLVFLGLYYFNRSRNLPDKSLNISSDDLTTIEVNGESFKTAGAIPPTDTDRTESIREMIKLVDQGNLSNIQFRIITDSGEGIRIEILPPYDQNKLIFLSWLKENGYTHIAPEQFIFINVNQ